MSGVRIFTLLTLTSIAEFIYAGRPKRSPTPSNDSDAGAVAWSKEKLSDYDDVDGTGTADIKNDTGEASPEWQYDTPVDYDSEDDGNDLVADDPGEQADRSPGA
ncbi:hypothetical protein CYMTET_42251 [Cymbomonas tetramitiformis]|uniref:Secreted protein n=1 Tax=Cymbomonas tetramitiformis TaxID=36881 RepID=A0AAE0C5K5_9CHLO|nr:hypothetical protein CYMTET_42251 [Cymbomonas tetramitiformis]